MLDFQVLRSQNLCANKCHYCHSSQNCLCALKFSHNFPLNWTKTLLSIHNGLTFASAKKRKCLTKGKTFPIRVKWKWSLRPVFNQSKITSRKPVGVSALSGFWTHWNHHDDVLPSPLPLRDKNSTKETPRNKTLAVAFPVENRPQRSALNSRTPLQIPPVHPPTPTPEDESKLVQWNGLTLITHQGFPDEV